MRQQRVAGNVERYAQERIGGPLVQVAAQLALCHVKLEKRVTGRQRHLVQIAYVPGAYDHAPAVGVVPELAQHHFDLVDMATIWCRPTAPLVPIHRPKVAVGICPLVPDGDAVLVQPLHISITAQEPQQLTKDAPGVELFGGQQREPLTEVKTHLVAKHAQRAGASAV